MSLAELIAVNHFIASRLVPYEEIEDVSLLDEEEIDEEVEEITGSVEAQEFLEVLEEYPPLCIYRMTKLVLPLRPGHLVYIKAVHKLPSGDKMLVAPIYMGPGIVGTGHAMVDGEDIEMYYDLRDEGIRKEN